MAKPTHIAQDSGSGRARLRRLALIIGGFAILALLVHRQGEQELVAAFAALGWSAPAVLLPFALIAFFDGWAWRFTLPVAHGRRASILQLTMIRLAGEAVNNATPTGSIGGEPVKALLLSRLGVHLADGTVSVVVAKTALTISQIVFILAGLLITLDRFEWIAHGDLFFAALCLAAAAFVALLVRMQQRQLFTRCARFVLRLGFRGERVQRFAQAAPRIDRDLGGYYRHRGRDFALSTLLHFIGWLLGTLDIKVAALLLGYPLSWRDAFIIESISQPLMAASAIIPGALGVREAGGVAIFRFLGLDETSGLAIWLLIRLRETAYTGLGMVYMLVAFRGNPRAPLRRTVESVRHG